MQSSTTLKGMLLFLFFFLALSGLVFLVYWSVNTFDDTDKRAALEQVRVSADTHRVNSMQSRLSSAHGDDVRRCDELERYERLTSLQPTDMSDEDLAEAIALYDDCGSYYPDLRTRSRELMSERVDEMEVVLEEIRGIGAEEREAFVAVWRSLDEVLEEQARTFAEFSALQFSFWEAEHAYRQGETDIEERNERFREFNERAIESQERISELNELAGDLINEERERWDALDL